LLLSNFLPMFLINFEKKTKSFMIKWIRIQTPSVLFKLIKLIRLNIKIMVNLCKFQTQRIFYLQKYIKKLNIKLLLEPHLII